MTLLGATSGAMRSLHSGVGRLTSALPRCPIIVSVGNMKTALNPRLVTRVKSISHFARQRTLATFTNISPNGGSSKGRVRGDIQASGGKSPCLHGTLFRVVSDLVGQSPISSPICTFVSGGQSRNGSCCICVATKTGGFLQVCCNQMERCLSGLSGGRVVWCRFLASAELTRHNNLVFISCIRPMWVFGIRWFLLSFLFTSCFIRFF